MKPQPVTPSGIEVIGDGLDDAERSWREWKAFTIGAYGRFHDTLERDRTAHPGLTSYDIVERVQSVHGTVAWWWGAASEVRETINSINAWGVRLREWGAWNSVIESFPTRDDQWDVLNHFVEPVAYFCMLQPSSFRDRLVVVAETLLHQANVFVFDEQDRLKQDDLAPGKVLRRSDRKKQLARLGRRWCSFGPFRDALWNLDDEAYAALTRNFRDLSAHSFAPRFMHGQISRAFRSIVPRQEIAAQEDGTYLLVEDKSRQVVSYAMSVLEPLPLDTVRASNLDEYGKARHAMNCFTQLIDELCDTMSRIPKLASWPLTRAETSHAQTS
jgi:hypothetical protein